MATSYPDTTTDNTAVMTLVGIMALIAIVALVYFVAGDRTDNQLGTSGPAERVGEQMDDAGRAARDAVTRP